MTEQAVELATNTVEGVKNNAAALGITWDLQPATIVSVDGDNIRGTIDGDEDITIMLLSLIGYVAPGTRVMTLKVPPSGTYIISAIGYVNDSAYTSFAMVTTAATPPTVGAGSQGARWTVIKHRTILLEGWVLFGAGMNQGVGRYFFPVPFNASAAGFAATGTAYIFDAGTANRGAFAINFTSALDQLFITNTPNGDVGAGVPQVFASGDQILFSIMYEVDSF